MKRFRGYLLIIAATCFWGSSATIAKFLFAHQYGTFIIVQMRMSLSAIALALVLAIFRRDAFKINLRDLHRFVLLGICGMAGSNFFYYYTIKVTTVATAILLQYMAPIVVLG
ncbi:MAG TPA: DMT family transporter, partial [Bacteroidota bacterium]|nr:DMT family transporter [Bacteroidota bacterium]